MLGLLGCLAVANLVRTATVVQWKNIGQNISLIWRGDGADQQTIADRECQPIREILAELDYHGRVGYMTDLRPGDDFAEDYYTTQYALVPTVVERVPDNLPYVIGNFHYPETDAEHIPGFKPVVISGHRVLFRRITP